MDFLNPKKKRAHNIRLFIGYGLMSILIGMGTLILLYYAFGFSFNLQTGSVTQNGLLFVDAHPQAAEVFINGDSRGFTDKRLILPSNNYSLELRREGYRSWNRDFLLGGGQIERLVYPFLFPENLESREDQLFSSRPAFATQSPDRRWLLIQQPGSYQRFSLVDLNNEAPNSVTIALPQDLFVSSGSKHDLSLVEWSTNNRHLVIKHTHSKGSEFILVDREAPGQSVNLTKAFDTPFTEVALRDKKFDRYYLYDSATQTIKAAERGSDEVDVILTKVLQFRPHGDDVLLYATTEGAPKKTVNINVREGTEVFTIRNFPENSKYLLDIARFEDKWYMVAGAVDEDKVYVMREPVAALKRAPQAELIPATTLRIDNAQYASFSGNARFVAVQAGSEFAVYDAENDLNYKYDTGLELTPGKRAVWMDGHRLTMVSEDKVEVFDFDGINRQTLVSSYTRFTPFFDRDYTALYSLSPSAVVDKRAALVRTELIVELEEN